MTEPRPYSKAELDELRDHVDSTYEGRQLSRLLATIDELERKLATATECRHRYIVMGSCTHCGKMVAL